MYTWLCTKDLHRAQYNKVYTILWLGVIGTKNILTRKFTVRNILHTKCLRITVYH